MPSWVGTTSVMKPGMETSAFVTFTGFAGLLFVTMMLRVIGSLPAVEVAEVDHDRRDRDARAHDARDRDLDGRLLRDPGRDADGRVQEALRRVRKSR